MNYLTFSRTLLILSILILSCSETKQPEEHKLSRIERNKLRSEYFFNKLKDPATNRMPDNIRLKELGFAKQLKSLSERAMDVTADLAAYEWNEVGPADVGGRTRAIALDYRDSDIVIAGGVSGGIWKSTNGGTTWESKLPQGSNLSISSIAQDTISGNIWYATSGEISEGGSSSGKFGSFDSPYLGLGIYKSIDNGETWELMTYSVDSGSSSVYLKDGNADTSIPNGLSHPFILTNKVFVTNSSGPVVVVTTQYSGIWISDDGGDSFRKFGASLTNGENPTYSDIIIDKEGVITVWYGPTSSGNNGFYRSYDGGQSFFTVNPSEYPAQGEDARTVLAYSANNSSRVYAFTYDGSTDHLYAFDFSNLSVDGGSITALDRTQNLPEFDQSIFGGTEEFSTQGGYDMALAVHPDDPDFVVLGYVNLIKSEDGFATSPTADPNKFWIGGNESPYRQAEDLAFGKTHHADQHLAFFDPSNPNVLWSGHDGGISKTVDITADRVVWESLNNDYNVTQFYTVATSLYDGDSYIVGGTQDNGTPLLDHASFQADLVASTVDISSGDGAYCFASGSIIYTSAQEGALIFADLENDYVSRFAGAGFISRDDLSRFFIHPFAVDPNDVGTIFYASNGNGVIARNDQFDEAYSAGSLDVSLINNGWDDLAISEPVGITAVKVTNQSPSHKLYFGGLLNGEPVLYSLTDANTSDGTGIVGRQLSEVSSGAWLNDIAVNAVNGDEIILVYSNYNIDGIFYSNDGGVTLTSIEGNLGANDNGAGITGPSIRAAEILEDSDGNKKYYVATSIGLYSTTTLNGSNTSWSLETPLLDNIVIEDLDLRQEDGALAVGTHGRGLFMGTPESTNALPVISDQSFDIDENSSEGSLIGTVTASDPDNDALTFAILAGNNDQQFNLNGANGELRINDAAAFDHETNPTFSLSIGVDDGNGGTSAATISISVNDINEAPAISSQSFSLDENVAEGTVVGSLVATDPDGDVVTFALAAADATFSVSEDGEITVINNSLIDFEANSSLFFEVNASDGQVASTASITVNINDLDDEVLSVGDYAINVYPNPSQDFVMVEGIRSDSEFLLTNLSGQVVAKGALASEEKSKIMVAELESGIYLLNISFGDQKETIRVIKE